MSQTEEKAETEIIEISLTVTSQAGLGIKVCNKELTHPVGFPPLLGSMQKKKTLLSSGHLMKWVSFHAAAQRTCTFLASSNTSLFVQLSLMRLRQVPCA